MGTAEAVVTPVAALPGMDGLREAGISVAPFLDGTSYCLVSGSANCGGLVSWFTSRYDEFGDPGCQPTGIIVQPYLLGRASPMPDPHRRLSVHGIGPGHTRADLARAVLEGICFQARWMLETQAMIIGTMPDSVSVLGGPTSNRTWMWIKAQVSPVPVAVAREMECAAVGAAQLAARALGLPHPALATRPQTRVPEAAAAFASVYRSGFLPLAALPSAHPDTDKGVL
jgi:xylulokinase